MARANITDKYYITYGIFYLLGILTFIPNYIVITAGRYWMFKFRFIGPRPPSLSPDDPNMGPPADRNTLQASFISSYYIVSQLSLIIFVIVTAAYSKRLPPPETRISAALLCTLVFYAVNLIFTKIITDSFQLAFFLMLMFIACFLGVCSAVIIVSLFEMVHKFPTEYYSAILTGQALCGVISAMILLLTIAVAGHPVRGGLIFFGIGTALVFMTYLVYWYCKRNSQYFIYHIDNDTFHETMHENEKFLPRIWRQVKSGSKHIKLFIVSLIIVFGTTAMVYPGLMTLVVAKNSNGKSGRQWDELYFSSVITHLLGNICDLCGRVLATKYRKPNKGPVILVLAICRIAFIPIFIFCNVQPRVHLPVVFYDAPYIVFITIFMFTNGYLINLCLTIVPTRAQNAEEKHLITVMTVLCGVFCNAVCSFLPLLLVHLL